MGYIDFEWLLSSFRGRASRLHFAIGALTILILATLAFFTFRMHRLAICAMDPHTVPGMVYFGAFVVVGAILTWTGAAITAKRLQDRGIPGLFGAIPWLGLWIVPLMMRFQADAACAAITPLRIALAGITLGLVVLVLVLGLVVPGTRFGNRYGDSLRKPRVLPVEPE